MGEREGGKEWEKDIFYIICFFEFVSSHSVYFKVNLKHKHDSTFSSSFFTSL